MFGNHLFLAQNVSDAEGQCGIFQRNDKQHKDKRGFSSLMKLLKINNNCVFMIIKYNLHLQKKQVNSRVDLCKKNVKEKFVSFTITVD